MEQEKDYDCLCLKPQCIKNKNCFFRFTQDNQHYTQNHDLEYINPMWISKMLAKIKNTNGDLLDQDKKVLMQTIDRYVDDFCQKMTTFFRQKYLKNFAAKALEELGQLKFDDPHAISSRLRSGDYEMLDEIINMKNNTIEKYPFHTYYSKKIEEVQKIAKSQISELCQAFTTIIDIVFLNKEDFLKIAKGDFEELAQDQKEEAKSVLKIENSDEEASPTKTRQGLEHGSHREISNYSQDYSVLEDLDSQGYRKRGRPKKKLITKPAGQKKSKASYDHAREKPLQKSYSTSQGKCQEEVSQLNSEEIIIRQCKKGDTTFQYIKNKYPKITGLHIFNHKMATKEILKKILKEFKNLKILTLNCSHDLEYGLLNELPLDNLQKIQNLEVKWDFNLFFKDNQISKFFPTKEPNKIEQYNRVYIPSYLLEKMKNNRSLVINSQKKIQNLKDMKYDCSKIQMLHFYRTKEDIKETINFGPISTLRSNKLKNLVSLNLSYLNIGHCENDFKDLIAANLNIQNINISFCKMSKNITNKMIQVIGQLLKLKRFALTQEEPLEIESELFFKLTSLQQLYLSNIKFTDKSSPEIKSSNSLKGLNQLKKLTHLSLYFIQYLDPQVLVNLQYLNVGLTEINNNFLKYFPKMKNLLYLNMDQSWVTGEGLLKACKDFIYSNVSYPPLKYLSIEETRLGRTDQKRQWSYTQEEMKQIGKQLPNLLYLEITECRNLIRYDFAEFKSLQTLALNKDMGEAMPRLASHIHKFIQ